MEFFFLDLKKGFGTVEHGLLLNHQIGLDQIFQVDLSNAT